MYYCYLYDAEGRRVAKGTISGGSLDGSGNVTPATCNLSTHEFTVTASYVIGPDGSTMTELDGSANWVHTDVPAGPGAMAVYDGSGLHFRLSDWLGSHRVQTSVDAATVEDTYQNLPFGEILNSPLGATTKHFTGKEHDDESGLDYFEARYFGSNMGRFISPDSTAYSGLKHPQSWNLYAYTLNNPLLYDDPTGHKVECKTNATDCLAAAQGAVGKEAAKQLGLKTTQSWFQKHITGSSTTTLTINGNEKDFRSKSGNAAKLADLIDSSANFGVSIQGTGDPQNSGILDSIIGGGSKVDLQGGAISYLPSQGYESDVFLDPRSAATVDTDAARDHIPAASLFEKFAHELLGHEWGEAFGGHRAGTAANKKDAIDSENEVRRTDPSRGQKTKHHD